MILGNTFKIISFMKGVTPFIIGLFCDGIASGGIIVVGVIWILDLQPEKLHKIYKPCIQICINLGILVSGIFQENFIVKSGIWYIGYWVSLVFSIALTIICIILPESYKFLFSKTRNEAKARSNLQMIRGSGYMEAELNGMIKSVEKQKSIKSISFFQFITTKRYLPAAISAIYINFAQQITGINAIIAFTKTIVQQISTTSAKIVDYIPLIIWCCALLGSILFVK